MSSSHGCRRLLFCVALLACPLLITAQPIDDLRPPREMISPTLWEQHGLLIVLSAVAAILAIALLIFLLCRQKQTRSTPPEILARRSLTVLLGRPEDGALITEVSRIFRRYVIFAFRFPPEELTTGELNRALQSQSAVDPALVIRIRDFLCQCDEEKFAPRMMPPRINAAARALELLETIEQRRASLPASEPAA